MSADGTVQPCPAASLKSEHPPAPSGSWTTARLKARTQQVACITYTEIAAQEIHAEVGDSPIVTVWTIHSFLRALAKALQKDIARWVRARVEASAH
jgi:hypothetical protein